jgi:mono/diheme cytochrome c family protein
LAFGCAGLSCCSGNWDVPEAAKGEKNPVSLDAAALRDASKIFSERCAHCHGEKGDGKRPRGSMYFYFTQPANFTESKIMDAMTDGEIFWKITTGNRPMPSYKDSLTDEERWELVDFLRTLAHPAGTPAPPSSSPTH